MASECTVCSRLWQSLQHLLRKGGLPTEAKFAQLMTAVIHPKIENGIYGTDTVVFQPGVQKLRYYTPLHSLTL
jgi:hypothetical protein